MELNEIMQAHVDAAKRHLATDKVLDEVAAERVKQFDRYGSNDDLENGTGDTWLDPVSWISAEETEREFRRSYEKHEARNGRPTWMHLVREEVAEAFQEDDPVRLREELIQVAALCVSWVEKLQD